MDGLKIGGASLKIASHGFVGAKGPKGDKGDPGTTVKVGTVTTGEAGSMASVTNVGTDSDAVFNFTIPRGSKGDKGDQGTQGYKGAKGDKGDKGDPGEQGLQGPKGDKGDRGDRGPQGYKGDPGEKGATGDKGDKGERGERGLTGLQGPQGIQGIQGVKGDKGDKGDPGEKGDTGSQGPKGDKGDPGDERDFFFSIGDSTTFDQVKSAVLSGKRACFVTTVVDDYTEEETMLLMTCDRYCIDDPDELLFTCTTINKWYFGSLFESSWGEAPAFEYDYLDSVYYVSDINSIGFVREISRNNVLAIYAYRTYSGGKSVYTLIPYSTATGNSVIFEGIVDGQYCKAVATGSDGDALDCVVTKTAIISPQDLSEKVDKSGTTVSDNASGGVNVQIQGTTKTVASQTDFTAQKEKTANLETTVGTSPASDETGLQLLSLLKEHANKMGGVVDIIAELPSDEIGLEIVSHLKDKTKLIKEIANNYEEAE